MTAVFCQFMTSAALLIRGSQPPAGQPMPTPGPLIRAKRQFRSPDSRKPAHGTELATCRVQA
jgi:hypothetical protein